MKPIDLTSIITGLEEHERQILADKGIVIVGEIYAIMAMPGGKPHLQKLLKWDDQKMQQLWEELENGLPLHSRRALSQTFPVSNKLGALLEPRDGPT